MMKRFSILDILKNVAFLYPHPRGNVGLGQSGVMAEKSRLRRLLLFDKIPSDAKSDDDDRIYTKCSYRR